MILVFLNRNNIVKNNLKFEYHIYKPKGILLTQYNQLIISHESQYSPAYYSRLTVYYKSRFKLKSYNTIGLYGKIRPIHEYDFREPRIEGMKLRKGSSALVSLWFSSDYRNEFALDIRTEYGNDFLRII